MGRPLAFRSTAIFCAVLVVIQFISVREVLALAVEYFVATTGSDANPGTLAAPWLTLQKAADVVPAGSNVNVRAGTYRPVGALDYVVQMTRSGTPSAPIAFQSYLGEPVVLEAASGSTRKSWGFYVNGGSHVTIRDFEIRGGKRAGVRVTNGNDVTIEDCRIHDFRDAASSTVSVGGVVISNGASTGAVVRRNDIYDCSSGVTIRRDTGGAIESPIVEENIIHDIHWRNLAGTYNNANADGVLLRNVNLATVRRNVVYGVGDEGLDVYNADNCLVEDNVLFNVGDGSSGAPITANGTGHGIHQGTGGGGGNTFQRNVIFNCELSGFDQVHNETTTPGNFLFNNVSYGNGQYGFSLQKASTTPSVLHNNISFLNNRAVGAYRDIRVVSPATVNSDFNLWGDGLFPVGEGANSLLGNPMFVAAPMITYRLPLAATIVLTSSDPDDPAWGTVPGFGLDPNSPGVDSGNPDDGLPYAGDSRDMGAYENDPPPPPPPTGRSLYVSTIGNDANPGTLNLPWRTIQHAVSAAIPGDTIFIRGGVYVPAAGTDYVAQVTASGQLGAPITVRNYPGETPILDARLDGVRKSWSIYVNGADHYSFDGLTLTGGKRAGIRMTGADYVTVTRCTVYDVRDVGSVNVVVAGVAVMNGYSEGNVITQNEVYDCSVGILVRNEGGLPIVAPLVERNYIHDIHWFDAAGIYDDKNADGLVFNTVIAGVARRNIIEACGDDGFDCYNSDNCLIEENTVFNHGDLLSGTPAGSNGDGNGIKISTGGGGGHLVLRNVAFNCERSGFDQDHVEITAPGNTYYHNLSYGNGRNGWILERGSSTANVFRNNIAYLDDQDDIGYAEIRVVEPATIDSDYNLWGDGVDPVGEGGHSLSGLPMFVSPPPPGAVLTVDEMGIATDVDHDGFGQVPGFRLLPTSPCIDVGLNVGLPYFDAAPDIGPYETP